MKDTGERLIVKGHEQTLTYGEHLSRYASILDITAGKVVLDVASGTGYGSQLIAKQAKKVTGLDYSEDAVAYAQEHYPASNLQYLVGDAHDMQAIESSSIDVVVSFETIEHLHDPAKFISEVKRVLKQGGQFIVSTPNDAEFMEGNHFHIHEFDLAELKKLIAKNFEQSEYYYQGTYFTAALLDESHFTGSFEHTDGLVSKTFAQNNGKAIFFIAVASDGACEKLNQNVVMADVWSTKRDIERDEVRTNHLTKLEKQNADLLEKNNEYAHEIAEIRSSKSWRITAPLRKILKGIK